MPVHDLSVALLPLVAMSRVSHDATDAELATVRSLELRCDDPATLALIDKAKTLNVHRFGYKLLKSTAADLPALRKTWDMVESVALLYPWERSEDDPFPSVVTALVVRSLRPAEASVADRTAVSSFAIDTMARLADRMRPYDGLLGVLKTSSRDDSPVDGAFHAAFGALAEVATSHAVGDHDIAIHHLFDFARRRLDAAVAPSDTEAQTAFIRRVIGAVTTNARHMDLNGLRADDHVKANMPTGWWGIHRETPASDRSTPRSAAAP